MVEAADVLVLVKAAPVLTEHLDESMCVAGIRKTEAGVEWIRLHPVPFRDLASDLRFAKYQWIRADLIRPKSDRRPETWTPIRDSIKPGSRLGTAHGWADRRELVSQLPELTMCDLNEANRGGSGEGVPSLGVVRPAEPPELVIRPRSEEQLAKWRVRAEAVKSRVSLFDDPTIDKPDFEVVPWRFSYRYRCTADRCSEGHDQTIVDWEVASLWRHVRHRPDWQELMTQKLVDEMWHGRDSVLFVGNQEQHPISFLVLGIFWPRPGWQPRLL